MSDIIITHIANGKIYIPPSFYPKDYFLYLMWRCPSVICRIEELQSLNNWLSLKISIVTKYVHTATASVSTEPAATEGSWRFSGKGAKGLLEIPFFIFATKQTLSRAYPPITHLSYRAQDHKRQPVRLNWITFARVWLWGCSCTPTAGLLWFSFTAFSLLQICYILLPLFQDFSNLDILRHIFSILLDLMKQIHISNYV